MTQVRRLIGAPRLAKKQAFALHVGLTIPKLKKIPTPASRGRLSTM